MLTTVRPRSTIAQAASIALYGLRNAETLLPDSIRNERAKASDAD